MAKEYELNFMVVPKGSSVDAALCKEKKPLDEDVEIGAKRLRKDMAGTLLKNLRPITQDVDGDDHSSGYNSDLQAPPELSTQQIPWRTHQTLKDLGIVRGESESQESLVPPQGQVMKQQVAEEVVLPNELESQESSAPPQEQAVKQQVEEVVIVPTPPLFKDGSEDSTPIPPSGQVAPLEQDDIRSVLRAERDVVVHNLSDGEDDHVDSKYQFPIIELGNSPTGHDE